MCGRNRSYINQILAEKDWKNKEGMKDEFGMKLQTKNLSPLFLSPSAFSAVK